MDPRFLRATLLCLLLGTAAAMAQPVPPAPPASAPAKPPGTGATTVKPTVKPAPRATVHAAPLVQPRPGAPATRPAAKPTPHHAPVATPPPAPEPPPPEPEKPVEQTKGSNTGSPLPRFVTLRSDEVNLRTGPGTRYPIDWVYKRRDLPVMIEREFDAWRLIRDPEGVKGWVHQATLAPRRSAVIIGGEQTLRHDPRDDAAPVARLKPGVILRLRSCEATSDWCLAQVQDYRGWIRRTEIWGTFPGEAIQ